MANEPDRGRRELLDRARVELTDSELNPHHRRIAETRREATRTLGAETYKGLYTRFGFELEQLAEQCERFLTETEDLYVSAFDRLFQRRVGVSLDEAKRWDLPRLFRATEWDTGFSAAAMVPALEATLAGLGIDLRAQKNVHLDLERRPTKTPRAFCAPIDVPERIMLVIQPMGGPDDWHALFHEAGHTEHYAHTSRDLPMEARRLGDNAVTEGWAMLLEHLTIDTEWLGRRLDFPRPREWATEGAVKLLWMLRRYCAKLLYELELQSAADVTALRPRYVELLGDALKVTPSDTDYLADVDDGFYASQYLRAWALEAQLRAYLRDRYGNAWFTRREAGSLVRELWNEGQKPNADEILAETSGDRLQLEAVADRIREAL